MMHYLVHRPFRILIFLTGTIQLPNLLVLVIHPTSPAIQLILQLFLLPLRPLLHHRLHFHSIHPFPELFPS